MSEVVLGNKQLVSLRIMTASKRPAHARWLSCQQPRFLMQTRQQAVRLGLALTPNKGRLHRRTLLASVEEVDSYSFGPPGNTELHCATRTAQQQLLASSSKLCRCASSKAICSSCRHTMDRGRASGVSCWIGQAWQGPLTPLPFDQTCFWYRLAKYGPYSLGRLCGTDAGRLARHLQGLCDLKDANTGCKPCAEVFHSP